MARFYLGAHPQVTGRATSTSSPSDLKGRIADVKEGEELLD